MIGREFQERWSRMLQDPVPETQLRALTEIGQAYLNPAATLEEVTFVGALKTKEIERPKLSTLLRDAVLGKLKAEDPNMRAEAALALVHWRDEKTIDSLRESLSDSDSTVRLAVVQAFAVMGEANYLPDLLEVAQNDPEELVRAHALLAIGRISKEAICDWEKESPSGAIRTRGGITMLKPVLVLEQIIKLDNSSYVAFLAQKARKRFGD